MKKIFTKNLILFLLFFVFSNTSAQTFPYVLEVENDTYTPLTDAGVITTVGDMWDDPDFEIPIGFDFEIQGQTYTTVMLEEYFLGGFLVFGDVYTQDSLPVIVAYIDDIIDIENTNPNMQSNISFVTEGSIGSRILKIEWDDVGFYFEVEATMTNVNRASFQLWLYETSNNIEFRYGPSTIFTPLIAHPFGGPTSGIFSKYVADDLGDEDTFEAFWHLSGNPNSPSVALATELDFDTPNLSVLTTDPEEGKVYRFANPNAAVNDPTEDLSMKIYPNAVEGEFYVEVSAEVLNKKTEIIIVNNLGQQIYINTITNTKERLDASDFPKGIYYITIFNEDGRGTKKIIKN